MAMGFFLDHAGEAAIAWSGGSEPGDQVNRAAVEAMKERGIDISGEYPKPWTDEIVRAADVVITMGCGDACPVFPGKRYEEWTLDDPAGLEVADVRPIRDEIERRVLVLPRCVAPVADAAHPGACVAETHRPGRAAVAPPQPLQVHRRAPADAGLTARTIAECMPGAASWVKVTSASTNPAAASPSRYSVRDRAPAMQPT